MYNYIVQNIIENIWSSDLYTNIKIGFSFDGSQYFILDSETGGIIDVFQTIGDFYITQNEIRMSYSDYQHNPYIIVLTKE